MESTIVLISALFLLIAVTLNSLDILVHVGEARSLTEYDPSETKWNEENLYFTVSSLTSQRRGRRLS